MPDYPDALRSEHLFDAALTLGTVANIGAGAFGQRSVHPVGGGTFAGPKMRGEFLTPGGDWLLTLANGHHELDVRVTMRTDDGALVYMAYRGILKADADVLRRGVQGEEVRPDEYYFRTTPRFETGSEKYAWLNSIVAVGVGVFGAGRVGYRVFAVL